jgi:glycosyltransferase involved in cell wall biosynthesis
MKLLMISTDRKIFEKGSPVALRQIERARDLEELHIIVFTDRSCAEMNLATNVWIYPTRSLSKWSYVFGAIRLGRFIIPRRKIDAITCQDPFLTAMAGASLKKQFGLPLEIQIHTDIGSPYFTYTLGNRMRKMLALSYLPKADTIRAVSEKIRSYVIGGLGVAVEKVSVRPIPVDTGRIAIASITVDLHTKYPKFSKIVLMASRLEREKNIPLALTAWSAVLKSFPSAGLIIVGSGSQEGKIRALVNRLGVTDSVVLEPWVDSTTLASYYKTADLFLNTSLYEGYGMTLAEAHAAGCAIVSTDVGIAREVRAHIVERDNDPSSVAAAVIASL